MPKTYYLSTSLLNHITNTTTYTSPSKLYVGLFTSVPSQSGGGTEVSGGDYTRVEVSFGSATNGVITNPAKISFPTATADWGTIVAVGIFDASTGGNLLSYDYLSQSRTIYNGDSVYFNAGELSWTEG